MSKIEIEKVLYKKPELNLGLNSLYRVHNDEIIIETDPSATIKPDGGSNGTGGDDYWIKP